MRRLNTSKVAAETDTLEEAGAVDVLHNLVQVRPDKVVLKCRRDVFTFEDLARMVQPGRWLDGQHHRTASLEPMAKLMPLRLVLHQASTSPTMMTHCVRLVVAFVLIIIILPLNVRVGLLVIHEAVDLVASSSHFHIRLVQINIIIVIVVIVVVSVAVEVKVAHGIDILRLRLDKL